MGAYTPHHRSNAVDSLQHLLQYIDELNPADANPLTLDDLLQFTHELSHTLAASLNTVTQAYAEGEAGANEHLPRAIDQITDSITTLKQMMFTIHHLRKAEVAKAKIR